MESSYKNFKPFLYIILLFAVMLFGVTMFILPTMDDWTYLSRPQVGVPFLDVVMPFRSYWRPFDGIIGYINGLYPSLFPYLNHLIVLTGHAINTILVYKIGSLIGLDKFFSMSSSCFFLLSPGMLGAVLDIDSANQIYSLLFGLLALIVYVRNSIARKDSRISPLYILSIVISMLWKENGVAFIVVAPLLSFGFGFITKKQFFKDILCAMLIPIVYAAIRFSLPQDNAELSNDYIDGGIFKIFRNIAMFITFTWLPVDFVSILHSPSRSYLLAMLTFFLAAPFCLLMALFIYRKARQKEVLTLLLCMIMIAGIHLVTVFSVMHTYSSLSFAALIVGFMLRYHLKDRLILVLYTIIMWLSTVFITDAHHLISAYVSGETGRRMARETLAQLHDPVDKAYVINLVDDYPKYSMFCTIPYEAFGWGISVQQENDYEWPTTLMSEDIDIQDSCRIHAICDSVFHAGYESVWVVTSDKVKVISNDKR